MSEHKVHTDTIDTILFETFVTTGDNTRDELATSFVRSAESAVQCGCIGKISINRTTQETWGRPGRGPIWFHVEYPWTSKCPRRRCAPFFVPVYKTEKLSLTKVCSGSKCRVVMCLFLVHLSSCRSDVFLSLGKWGVVKLAEWHNPVRKLKWLKFQLAHSLVFTNERSIAENTNSTLRPRQCKQEQKWFFCRFVLASVFTPVSYSYLSIG